MKIRPCSIWISVAFVLVGWSASRGQVLEEPIMSPTGPIEIEADRVIHYREQNLYEAVGNVEIRAEGFRLNSDEVRFYPDTGIAEAQGNVEVTDGEDILRCESIRINIETQKGVVDNARLSTQEGFFVTGRRVEKLGPKTYRIHDGSFTTCGGPTPDWIVRAKRLDVTLEGYGVARNPVFAVRKIPVAYLPIGVFPVKTKRQTGFLIPTVGYSNKFGPEVNLPFFWAISQDKDATIYTNWLGDRGLKEGGEFRYALTKNMEGQANFYYIDDQEKDTERWAFLFQHDQRELPLGFYAKGDINIVSDNDYPFDFEEDFRDRSLIDVRTERQLESTFFGGRAWPEYNLVGEFSYFDDLTLADDDSVLQRLPEIGFAAFDQRLWNGPVYGGGAFSYTNFLRQEGVRGSRLDFFPQVSLPLRPLDWLKFLPVGGVRETLYWPREGDRGEDDFEARFLPSFDGLLSTTISRVFDTPSWWWEKVRHSIQPEVGYRYIPRTDQDDLPFFDEGDRIPYTNEITYGLTNFLYGKLGSGSDSKIRRLLQFELSQSYSLGDPLFPTEDSPEKRLSNIRGELWLFPFSNLELRGDAEYSLVEDQIVLYNTLANLSDARGDSLTVEYRFVDRELEELNLYGRVRLWDWADLFGSFRYNLRDDLRVETLAGMTYRAQCWNVTFSVEDRNRSFDRTRDDEIKFNLSVSLVGLGSI
jgi:LPS-assembly protein